MNGRPVVEVCLEVRTFLPRERGSHDTRELGVAVCAVDLRAEGPEQEPIAAPLAWEVDWSQAPACARRVGRGATLVIPGQGLAELNEAVVQSLLHPERLVPGARGVQLPLVEAAGIYATQLADGVLYYNATGQPQSVNGVAVPAHGIAKQGDGK